MRSHSLWERRVWMPYLVVLVVVSYQNRSHVAQTDLELTM